MLVWFVVFGVASSVCVLVCGVVCCYVLWRVAACGGVFVLLVVSVCCGFVVVEMLDGVFVLLCLSWCLVFGCCADLVLVIVMRRFLCAL